MRLSPNIYHQAVNTIRWKPPRLICYDGHVMSWERGNNTFINHLELLTTVRLWAGGRLFLFTRQESRRNPAQALTTINGSELGGLRDKTNNIRSTTTRHRKSCLLPCYCEHDLCWLMHVLYIHMRCFNPLTWWYSLSLRILWKEEIYPRLIFPILKILKILSRYKSDL